MKELASHPTVKPVALVADALLDCTERGDVVLDQFAGSGTLFLAAEKIGRTGYGMEYEPRYVDVAIQRWQSLTKLEATLEGDGRAFEEIAALRENQEVTDPVRSAAAPQKAKPRQFANRKKATDGQRPPKKRSSGHAVRGRAQPKTLETSEYRRGLSTPAKGDTVQKRGKWQPQGPTQRQPDCRGAVARDPWTKDRGHRER